MEQSQNDKKSFYIAFITVIGATVLSLILFLIFKIEILGYGFFGGLCLIFMMRSSFKEEAKMQKYVANAQKGQLEFEPHTLSQAEFVKECQDGLLPSVIRINGQIYTITVQIDEVRSTNPDKFTCYVNDTEITGLDNFLDYKIDGERTIRNLPEIEFLTYNNAAPKTWFVERKM